MLKFLNNNLVVSINFILLLLSFPVIFLFKEIGDFDISIYYGTFYILLFMAFLKKESGSYLSPVSIFLCFYWLMLMGRPFLSQMGLVKTEVVEASVYDLSIGFYVNVYIVITLLFIGFLFWLVNGLYMPNIPTVRFPEFIITKRSRLILVLIFLFFGVLMLRDGRTAYYTLQQSNYIELIESGEIVYFNPIFYTLVKWSWFLLFISYPNKSGQITLLFMFFLLALPVSGMRGYFILYLLMGLMFLEGKKIINLKLTIIIPFIFGLLSLVTFLLEYRIGFSVSDSGVMSPVYNAIIGQGSTYEVIYGAYNFKDRINFFENVLFPSLYGFPTFGNYIDKLRGVDFADGIGFATSALAEIISGGVFIWIVYLSIFSFALSVVHKAFLKLHLSNSYYFTLFFMAPIIWGQPRGAALQFLFKFLFFIAIVFLFHYYKIKKIKI